MEVVKWDGVSRKDELADALMKYIDNDDIELAKRTSYGDLGKALKKKHGSIFHGSVRDRVDVQGEGSKVTVTFCRYHEGYELTWNKAAKLLHEVINTQISFF